MLREEGSGGEDGEVCDQIRGIYALYHKTSISAKNL